MQAQRHPAAREYDQGILRHEASLLRLDFAEPPALPQYASLLDEKRIERQRAAALLTRDESLLGKGLGLLEAPSISARIACSRSPRLKRSRSSASAVRYSRCPTSAPAMSPDFDEIGDSIVAGLEREIALPGALGDRDHFAPVGEPLLQAVRVSQRQMAAPQRDDRRVRIVDPPRHLDGLLAKRDGLLALRPV